MLNGLGSGNCLLLTKKREIVLFIADELNIYGLSDCLGISSPKFSLGLWASAALVGVPSKNKNK